MKNLFFYGTLRDIQLLEIVLGRSADTLDLKPIEMPGYRVTGVAEGPFPTIFPVEGAAAPGLLVKGLSAEDIARLDFYEGGFDYDLVSVMLPGGTPAEFYMSRPGRWTPTQEWSLEDWSAEHGPMTYHAATEVMRLMGHKTRDEVAAMYPRIRDRACARVRAGKTKRVHRTFQGKVEISKIHPAYAKFFALDELDLRHSRYDGSMSAEIDRAVLISSDAAIVLPYDPVRDRVLLVEQVRMGPLMRGDTDLWQLEPIAGLIDAGETPEDSARREAVEEAGIRLRTLEKVAELYPSPGNSTGYYYVFLAVADLPDDAAGVGGLDDEGEDIRSHLFSFDALMDLVDTQSAANAPLVIAALSLARHRDRLRSGQGADRA